MSAPEAPRPEEADEALLSAYVDGELSGAERVALEARLAREPRLAEILAALRAGGELIRSADAVPVQAAPSRAFAALGSRLADAVPQEIPVAPVLKPPILRRIALGAGALVLGIFILALGGRAVARWGGPRQSGWWADPAPGAQRARGKRMVPLDDGPGLLRGDTLYVDAGTRAALYGPAGLEGQLLGPAELHFDGSALILKEGALTLKSNGSEAGRWLDLRTPDGTVKAPEAGPFEFTVEVAPGARSPSKD